jgi:nucleotide-binding universal stress UspA family protein
MYTTILLTAALQRWERFSEHALAARDVSLALAKGTSQHLHVLSAYDYEIPTTTGGFVETIARLREEYMQRTDNLMEQKLDAYIAPLQEAGLAVTKILQVGNPREIIVQVAANIGADLLIMGSHSKRGLIDITLGGTAQQVSRRAPCPVVLVSPKA